MFTCSSRDYVRITGRIERDGDPSCFSNIADTGVPALQQWCRRLAIGNQHRAAKQYHLQLKIFANSVRAYTDGISDATVADSKALREKWESVEGGQGPALYDVGMKADHFDIPGLKGFKSAMNNTPRIKMDPYGEPTGITPRLVKVRSFALTLLSVQLTFHCRILVHVSKDVSQICKVYSMMALKTSAERAQSK